MKPLWAFWLNVIVFQIGWFACVLGGNIIALIYTLAAMVFHYRYLLRHRHEIYVLLGLTVVGASWDSFLLYAGVFSFSSPDIAIVPVWLICLWLLFSSTLNHSLAWLQEKLLLAIPIIIIAAPLSYIAGASLGGVSLAEPLTLTALIIAAGWVVIFPLGLYACKWCRNV